MAPTDLQPVLIPGVLSDARLLDSFCLGALSSVTLGALRSLAVLAKVQVTSLGECQEGAFFALYGKFQFVILTFTA